MDREEESQRIRQILSRQEFEMRITRLTHQELTENVTPTARVYRPIGKAYLLSDMKTIKDSLERVASRLETEIGQLRDRLCELDQSPSISGSNSTKIPAQSQTS